ncbi:MAG: polysaccharide deacetylase family protein [Clostridia bacterium]|nr:polysaccharide deacetylase family protein [Clostridia bacterium]
MFNGKNKAITFSFDDGVTQDIRLIEIFNKYNLKATFNLNSELLGLDGEVRLDENTKARHMKVKPEDVKHIYQGHEVAVHTLTHPRLPEIEDDKEIIRQVEQDRLNLSKLADYDVVGMAYPCGGVNNDDRVAKIIKENTGVKYSRTITSNYGFDLQANLYRFNPTLHLFWEFDKMDELAVKFLEMEADKPQIFYIWGHAYEFDFKPELWDRFDKFCELISNKNDIFYGTNKEVLL